eukprot:TRINITY_DN3282_c0_g1_i4.p1 TRINITY_DN3282_c0_g1~~TRINITY_DN3282_c0_g1_i4.p1  ORF type:complete len:859 (-),score=214.36 TRINITY_DN3282_c0_g1_i4:147-2651(-)
MPEKKKTTKKASADDGEGKKSEKEKKPKKEKGEKKASAEKGEKKKSSKEKPADGDKKKSSKKAADGDKKKSSKKAADGEKAPKKKKAPAEDQPAETEEEEYEEEFDEYEDDGFEPEEPEPAPPPPPPEPETPEQIEERLKQERLAQARDKYSNVDAALKDVMIALDAENEAVLQRINAKAEKKAAGAVGSRLPERKFVDLAASRMSVEAQKRVIRSQEVLELVEMDIVSMDIFDMAPLTEYMLYMRSFGQNNANQASTQTGDAVYSAECQTESVEVAPAVVQFPDDMGFSAVASSGAAGDESGASRNVHRLAPFVQSAAQVCEALMDEAMVDTAQKAATFTSSFAFSSQYISIEPPAYLAGRPVLDVSFSVALPHLMLTVHAPPPKGSAPSPLGDKGLVVLWNLNDPQAPYRLLQYPSTVTTAAFSPDRGYLVFAGSAAGSVALWDLREYSYLHPPRDVGGKSLEIRNPTYSSDSLFGENHASPVSRILATARSRSADGLAEDEADAESQRGNLRVATLDETGQINVWLVTELLAVDWGGSESDYGLAIGGRVTLVKVAGLRVLQTLPREVQDMAGELRAFDFAFDPSDANQFFVGSDVAGAIVRGERFAPANRAATALPLLYTQNPLELPEPNSSLTSSGTLNGSGGIKAATPKNGTRPASRPGSVPPAAALLKASGADCSSIAFSPYQPQHFLAGYTDGSVALYSVSEPYPLATWETKFGQTILHIEWSSSRPCVFFAMTSSSIYTWDLLQNPSAPVSSEANTKKGKWTRFSLSEGRGTVRQPALGIAFNDGHAEVHIISARFTLKTEDEEQKFQQYLSRTVSIPATQAKVF